MNSQVFCWRSKGPFFAALEAFRITISKLCLSLFLHILSTRSSDYFRVFQDKWKLPIDPSDPSSKLLVPIHIYIYRFVFKKNTNYDYPSLRTLPLHRCKKKRNSQLEWFQNLQLTFGFANPYFKRGQTWEEKLDIAVQKKVSIVYYYKQ